MANGSRESALTLAQSAAGFAIRPFPSAAAIFALSSPSDDGGPCWWRPRVIDERQANGDRVDLRFGLSWNPQDSPPSCLSILFGFSSWIPSSEISDFNGLQASPATEKFYRRLGRLSSRVGSN